VSDMSDTAQPQPTADSGHVEPTTVHFDDLDSMGMVHNARYAVMLERALNNFWTRQGYTFTNGTYSHPDVFVAVAEFSISYKMPVRGTGEINIQFWVDHYGESSVVYAYRVLSADGSVVHAEGRRVHIRLDPKSLRPTPWAADTNAIYQKLMLK
jgi:acyl-CoA thioester hydrolase